MSATPAPGRWRAAGELAKAWVPYRLDSVVIRVLEGDDLVLMSSVDAQTAMPTPE